MLAPISDFLSFSVGLVSNIIGSTLSNLLVVFDGDMCINGGMML